MISRMTTARRPQQRYDHRLRELVQRTGDLTSATDLGVPRSTARGWLRTAPTVTVSLDVANLTELELRHEILKLRRCVQKLAALLRLALVLLRVSGFTLSGERLPNGPDKLRILRAIESGPRVHPVARTPAAPPSVTESVPRLATAAHPLCTRRPVILSALVTGID